MLFPPPPHPHLLPDKVSEDAYKYNSDLERTLHFPGMRIFNIKTISSGKLITSAWFTTYNEARGNATNHRSPLCGLVNCRHRVNKSIQYRFYLEFRRMIKCLLKKDESSLS